MVVVQDFLEDKPQAETKRTAYKSAMRALARGECSRQRARENEKHYISKK